MVICSLQCLVQSINDERARSIRSTTLKAGNLLMTTSTAILRAKAISLFGTMTFMVASSIPGFAQKPVARILAPIDNANRSTLTGSRPMFAAPTDETGRLDSTTQFEQMNIVFSRSAAQQSALDALVEAQQNPASPKFHQWLSPEEFGAQFGAADADIAKVQAWLQSQGFTVGEVSRDHTMITFSGAVSQIETAFATEMHYFAKNGETHFAPASDVSLPAAIAPAVLSVGRLTDARPHSHMHPMPAEDIKANFTSNQTGNHFVQPGDVAIIYDINAAYSAGYTGSGQSIVVIGQSAVTTADITNFQTAAGVPVRAPTLTLIPGTGTSVTKSGDWSESDLDLEYTSAIAKGATINFVYTGNASNSGGAFYSLQYAIQNKLAPIISSSYGDCEIDLGSSYYASAGAYLQQAAAQGQTVISASGDNGSTDCYQNTNLSLANRQTLAVDWPASSQYVTAMGGTEFTSAAIASGNSTYFTAASGSDVLVSAKSYIPEQVWNDDSSTATSSGGGGVSIFTPRPSWQTGITGIPAGTFRLLPDISLASSPNNAGYLYCSSDTSTGITGSCANGFRDSSNSSLTVAGGTSFAAPIFAGMLAIINQRTNVGYAGLINPTLYALAADPTTYASAFHDITSGTNACTSGTSICGTGTGTTAYAATTGYDQATGLGSIDFYNLLQAWATLQGTIITTSPAASPAISGTADVISVKVAPISGTGPTPTGTVSVYVDDSATAAATLTLTGGGTASYTYPSQTVLGSHTIKFTYSGDTNYPAKVSPLTLTSSTLTLLVRSPGSFTLAASAVSVTAGSTATATINLTPTGGYFGLTNLTLKASTTIVNTCYTLTNPTVTGTSVVAVSATIYTNSASCPSGAQSLLKPGTATASNKLPTLPGGTLPAGLTMAGLLVMGFAGRKNRRLRGLVLAAMMAVFGFALSGCGSTSTAGAGISTVTTASTYTITVSGTDAATGTIVATPTTFTLTIQ